MQIVRVRLAECSIPLPHVLRLGPTEIKTRDYVAVQVETDSGLFGETIGYPRGTPLFEVLSSMSRQFLGQDARNRRQLMSTLEQRNVPGRAGLTRGLSMMDIALWDIACKEAQLPLYRLLGGLRQEAAVTAVAGYYMDIRSIETIADEVALRFDEGYQRVKVMLKGDDPEFDRNYTRAVVKRARERPVAADAHWSWTTVTEAKRLCRDLDTMGLDFLEDPFAASDWRFTHELQEDMRTMLAAGEDVFGIRAFADLVPGIGILRVDATTCGGITGAIEAIHLAAGSGRTVFPHVFSPLHVHFACAFPNVEGAEYISEASGADPIDKLLRSCPTIRDGKMEPSDEPGVGIQIDWEKVEKVAKRVASITADNS